VVVILQDIVSFLSTNKSPSPLLSPGEQRRWSSVFSWRKVRRDERRNFELISSCIFFFESYNNSGTPENSLVVAQRPPLDETNFQREIPRVKGSHTHTCSRVTCNSTTTVFPSLCDLFVSTTRASHTCASARTHRVGHL